MAKKVFLGVGHGGTDPGASKYVVEKDVNLVMAKACRDYLEYNGVNVLMSRTKDENDPLSDEIKECNAYNPDLAVDVHNNAGGGDGFDGGFKQITHIQLGGLAGQDVLGVAGLAGHFVGQGDALGLGGDDVVVFGGPLQQFPGTGNGQFRVSKADECANIQIIRNFAKGQFPLHTCDFHGICTHKRKSSLKIYSYI